MGVSESYVRRLRAGANSSGTASVAVVVAYLLVDLVAKLAGFRIVVLQAQILGGNITLGAIQTFATDGLILGLAIGLAGIGLSMTYSILNFANFAHGDYVTAGAFSGWAVAYLVSGGATLGSLFLIKSNQGLTMTGTFLAIVVGLVVAAGATIALTLVLDRFVYRPMREAEGISLLIASIGVALALRYVLAFVWSTRQHGVTGTAEKVILLGLTTHQFTLIVVSLALMAGVHVLLQYTKLGKAMRAMADNEDLARVTGIPTEHIIRLTWIIGGGLTGVAGYLIVLDKGTLAFNFGWVLLLLIFAAVILGGIGSIYGAMAGGVIIGMVDAMSTIWIPSGLTRAAVFVVLILVLLIRPEGLFGGVKTA